ncbi:MAG TPA: RNA 2'-phosphotransferase [Aggregatilineales bacterium]|nr:RNA 2'-phosphotransferase [Aggregatilineales bacterium]
MDEKRAVKISKYLSLHLRHRPDALGLTLAPGGWVAVDDLLAALERKHLAVSREALDYVVAYNDKQHFSFDETGTRIRANQGHSVEVDLQLDPAEPPALLSHGTGEKSVDAILTGGLKKMARHHVHLSRDIATAEKVGARHGTPVIFIVAAGRMHAAGHEFFVSDNGVWLTDHVPVEFLQRA